MMSQKNDHLCVQLFERLKKIITDKMNTNEIAVDEIVAYIFKEINHKGKDKMLNKKSILDFFKNQNLISYEIYKIHNWLSKIKIIQILFFIWIFEFFWN